MSDDKQERIDVLEQRLHEMQCALPEPYKCYQPDARISNTPGHMVLAFMVEDPCGVWVKESHLLAAAGKIAALQRRVEELEAENHNLSRDRQRIYTIRELNHAREYGSELDKIASLEAENAEMQGRAAMLESAVRTVHAWLTHKHEPTRLAAMNHVAECMAYLQADGEGEG